VRPLALLTVTEPAALLGCSVVAFNLGGDRRPVRDYYHAISFAFRAGGSWARYSIRILYVLHS